MSAALVLGLSLVFGGADQYLGSLSGHPWAVDVSLLSAPWLVLPFVVGIGQRTASRAAVLGGGATFCALVGYGAMTLSPVENAHFSADGVAGFLLRSGNYRWFIAGLVTGPLLAWLGHRWRLHRAWPPVVTLGALLSLEPLAHAAAGTRIGSSAVTVAETAAGVAAVVAHAVYRFTRAAR